MSLGPSFFESFKNFPGTSFIFQVPVGFSKEHLSADAISQAKAAVKAIGISNLDSLEIGNEPDLYVNHHVRPPGYNVGDYVKNFLQYAEDVNGNITALDKKIIRHSHIPGGMMQLGISEFKLLESVC